MIEFETSAIVITALIEHMTDEIMDQFVKQGHVPVVFVKEDHEMFVQMKEKVEKENDTLLHIVYQIKYKKPFEA